MPTELPISSPSLGFNPTRLGCLWRYPWKPPLTTLWLWDFIGLSGPGGTGADGKSSAAEGREGQHRVTSSREPWICPTTPRPLQEKQHQQNQQHPPDSAVLLSLFSMGCSPPFYFSCCFSKDVFSPIAHTLLHNFS